MARKLEPVINRYVQETKVLSSTNPKPDCRLTLTCGRLTGKSAMKSKVMLIFLILVLKVRFV